MHWWEAHKVRKFSIAIMAVALFGLGCDGKKEDPYAKFKTAPAPCETDSNCIKGFICKDKKCTKGERSAAELAEKAKTEAEAKKKAAAKKNAVKPGEGRLYVRLCPGFKNTPSAIGTVMAVHQETKKRHPLHLALLTPEGGWKTEYRYPSLPLGKYDVTANYGVNVRGKVEVVNLKCDPKAKPCRDKTIREMEVVLPADEPAREKGPDGKPKFKACDWVAE